MWKYGVIHILYIFFSFYFFGYLKGAIAIFMVFNVVKFLLILFGYHLCVGNDLVHFYDSEKVPHN